MNRRPLGRLPTFVLAEDLRVDERCPRRDELAFVRRPTPRPDEEREVEPREEIA